MRQQNLSGLCCQQSQYMQAAASFCMVIVYGKIENTYIKKLGYFILFPLTSAFPALAALSSGAAATFHSNYSLQCEH